MKWVKIWKHNEWQRSLTAIVYGIVLHIIIMGTHNDIIIHIKHGIASTHSKESKVQALKYF